MMSTAPLPRAPAPATAGTVLVVDDDDSIRSVVRLALEDEGYEVVTAAHGADALRCIRSQQPALILLDLQMPVMSGWQLLAHLGALARDIPVVIMTAGARARAVADELRTAGYLGKPFDLARLIETVERLMPPAH
jgi:CheY-like chemotaxis protein